MADPGRTDRLLRSLRLRPAVPDGSPSAAPEADTAAFPARSGVTSIVDAGIYVAGRRIATPTTFVEAFTRAYEASRSEAAGKRRGRTEG